MSEIAMTDAQYRDLLRVTTVMFDEADRCSTAGAYLAGCVMLGAGLEAALIAICDCFQHEIPERLIPKRKRKALPVLEWKFPTLVEIARVLDWLPAGLRMDEEWDDRKAKIGDHA